MSTKSCWLCEATCGLCKVAVCSTADTPSRQDRTSSRSGIDPVPVVPGEARTYRPATCEPRPSSPRQNPSPRCPALPVTSTFACVMSATIGGSPARRHSVFRRFPARRPVVRAPVGRSCRAVHTLVNPALYGESSHPPAYLREPMLRSSARNDQPATAQPGSEYAALSRLVRQGGLVERRPAWDGLGINGTLA